MCYSARIEADYRKYVREYGAEITFREFVDLFYRWARPKAKLYIPRGMVIAFRDEPEIAPLIAEHDAQLQTELEQDLFVQRQRLVEAERKLQTKNTKAALESRRIASSKIERALGKMAELRRTVPEGDDLRIFPRHYAPVMVMENGRRVVKPMRYQLRPAGKPPFYDDKFPGTYNARRDSLDGYWRGVFGYTHGVVIADAFYENVNRHRAEGRDLGPAEEVENLVLEFKPQTGARMLIACLWSQWTGPGEADLLSFAAITDEPPPEVAAAGHDRCVIPIKPEHIDTWLNPDPKNLKALHSILDDRERPYYEHRLAA
jgi:putative SOS response-associated peptidase YedK